MHRHRFGVGAADHERGAGTSRSVAVYLVRDGKVAPVRRTLELDGSLDPIQPTLVNLASRKPTEAERAQRLETAVPVPDVSGGEDAGVTVVPADGLARVGLWSEPLPRLAQAQIVYTLTRFPGIRQVVFVVDGKEGAPVGRGDFEAETPQILVESPLPGDTARSPIRLRGTANVFEATVSIDVRDANGDLLERTFTTATSGTGTRGTFDTELALRDHEGEVTVVAYESSAKDGSPLHVVELPLELAR